MRLKTRATVVRYVIFLAALSGCAPEPQTNSAQSAVMPVPEQIVIPANARELKRTARDGTLAVIAEAPISYPAESYLCDVSSKLRAAGWRPLRESVANSGLPSSFVRGWWDFTDASKQPEEHVHGWMTEWLGPNGELLFHSLEYRYGEGAAPKFDRLRIFLAFEDQSTARRSNGARYGELFQLTTDSAPAITETKFANCASSN
jgi:hypothetical protein